MSRVSGACQLSIGLPVYNGENYVAEAIESLLAQTYQDFEVVICDNSSTDRTGEICSQYAQRDGRIRYVRNLANLGAARNYRRTFELSRGKYFRWATGDDVSGREFLAHCIDILDRDPSIVLAYPRTKLIDAAGTIMSEVEDRLHLMSPSPSERFTQCLERVGFCNAIYGVMRAPVLKRTRLMGDYVGSDVLFLAELSLYGKFWEVPEFLFFRRLHPAAYSGLQEMGQRLKFYNPHREQRVFLREWRHLWESMAVLRRARLDTSEKARLYAYILRTVRWKRTKLARELCVAVRQAVGRVAMNSRHAPGGKLV